jgi:hypothetical protein
MIIHLAYGSVEKVLFIPLERRRGLRDVLAGCVSTGRVIVASRPHRTPVV